MHAHARMDMPAQSRNERDEWDRCRHIAGAQQGHYESYFQRANHPLRPLAFWVRHTIFSPKGRPEDAVGEVWAVWFDGERRQITAAKEVHPLRKCVIGERSDMRIGQAVLSESRLEGSATSPAHRLAWSLNAEGAQPPLLLLPRQMYDAGFPKAKALVSLPNALFHGMFTANGEEIPIDGWQGSMNHNWGSRHTDSYAWGQVAGFDGAPDTFLECATARLRVGPFWTPAMSVLVLRVGEREYALNGVMQSLRAHGRFELFDWTIRSRTNQAAISVHIHAPRDAFVGLHYANPPGGGKTCLNSKIAHCTLTLDVPGEATQTFVSKHRAAFEILTDRHDHGVMVAA